ncbi:MAG: TonB-dependent receptor [Flavobacteriaceae bacterium]|jgi:hypothetical protein|nr:TonB-dependent receptor [Flavobacteriaceae bacterium]
MKTKIIKNLLIPFFLFLGMLAFSQELYISGRAVEDNNTPLDFAEVTLSIKDSIIRNELTQEDGSFTLSNLSQGSYMLQIKQIGEILYSQDINLTNNLDLGSIIIQKVKELQSITVTGQKKLIERKVDRLIFNVENSVAASGGDALDALKVTPGIRIKNDQISMIGKSGMAVMIDDKLVQISGEDLVNYLRSIPSDNIKSIEVITTPPAKYDAEGNSGIINIQLKKAKKDSWNASLRSSYTQATYAKGSFGGSFDYQKNKLSLYTNINYGNGLSADIQSHKIYYPEGLWNEESKRKQHQNSLNARLGVDYKITDNWNMGVQYLGRGYRPTTKENILTTIYNADNSSIDSYIKTLSDTKNNKHDNQSINLNSIIEMDTIGKKMILNFDYFKYKDFYNRSFTTLGLVSANNPSLQDIENYSAKLDFEHPLKWVNLTYGGKVSFIKTDSDVNYFDITTGSPIFDPTQSNVFEYKENTQSIYISATKNISKKWETQVGLRLENTQTQGYSQTLNQKNNNNYTKLFPTFYITYTPTEKNTFSLNYNKRINRPPYGRLNPFRWYTSPFYYSEGNPFLQPSFTDNIEFNYTHNDNWSNSLHFSHTKNGFEQITIVDNDTNIQRTIAENFFSTSVMGISESYTFKKLRWLSSTFSFYWFYSWSKSSIPITNQTLNGADTYFSTSNDLILNASKTLVFNISYWYNFKGVSDLDKNNAYSQLDASIKYLALNKKLQISLNINDILSSNRPAYISYTNNIRIDYKNYFDYRLFRLSLTYKFGNDKISVDKKNVGNQEEINRTN